jgi:hypothetical protein
VNIQQFVTTEFGTKLWMALGRWLPTSAGHAFARTVTGVLSRRRDTSLYRTMRANQAGVLGPDASPEQLDAATRAVLGHAGMTAFDLMHIMAQGEDAVLRAVDFGADFWANVELLKATGRGVLVCGCHLSNFNLAFMGFAIKDQRWRAAESDCADARGRRMRYRRGLAGRRGERSSSPLLRPARPPGDGLGPHGLERERGDLSDGVPVVTRTRLLCHQPAADYAGSDRRPRGGRAGQRPPHPGCHGKLDRRNAGAVVDVSPGVAGRTVNS